MASRSAVQVGSLEARLCDVRLPIGLVLHLVEVSAGAGEMALDTFETILQDEADLRATIRALDLANYLDILSPAGMQGFVVTCREGTVLAEAVVRMLVPVRASAECKLRIVGEDKVYVDVVKASVLGAGMTSLVESHLQQLNPVVDLAGLPWTVRLTSIAADQDQIVLQGKIRPQHSPAA